MMPGTMAVNPAFLQSALLRQSVANPLAGTFNTNKVTADTTGAAMKHNLATREAGLKARLTDAMVQDMANKMALERGYLGISEGRLGLAQKQLGLDTQKLGQSQQEEGWRQKNWRKGYDTESSNLWKTGAMGLGTAAWSAYEGNRRAGELEADRAANADFRRAQQQYYVMNTPTPQAKAGWANWWQH